MWIRNGDPGSLTLLALRSLRHRVSLSLSLSLSFSLSLSLSLSLALSLSVSLSFSFLLLLSVSIVNTGLDVAIAGGLDSARPFLSPRARLVKTRRRARLKSD